MHLSDIYWPVFGILGENILISDNFLKFNRKFSLSLLKVKKGKIGDLPKLLFFYGWHLWERTSDDSIVKQDFSTF